MKIFQKIFSLTLLSIYSLIIVHNVVPHSHDYSELDGTLNEQVHHGHDHHNHGDAGAHESHEAHESTWVSFFINMFEGLEHSNLEEGHFENYLVPTIKAENDLSLLTYGSDDFTQVHPSQQLSTISLASIIFEDPPPILKEHLLTCSDPLRGPPSIS